MSSFFDFKNKEKLSYGFRKTSIGIASFLLCVSLFLTPMSLKAEVTKIKGGTQQAIITETDYTNKLPEFIYKKLNVKMVNGPSNLDPNNMKNVTIEEVDSEIEGLIKYKIGLNVENDFEKFTGSYTSNPYLGFFISKGYEFEKVVLQYQSTYIGFTNPVLDFEGKNNPYPTVINRNVEFTKNDIKTKTEEIRANIDNKAFERLVIGEQNGKYVVAISDNYYENFHLRMVSFNIATKDGIIHREPSMLLKDFTFIDENASDYARNNENGPELKELTKSTDDNFYGLKSKDTVSSVFFMKEANNNWASGVRGDVPITAYVYVKPTRKDGLEYDKSRYVAGFLKSYDNATDYRRVALAGQEITLEDAKTQAISYVNNLKYLTGVQKQRIISNINDLKANSKIYGSFKDSVSLQDIMYRAQIQDTQMKQLKTLVTNYEPIKNKGKYIYANDPHKKYFDTALENAKQVLSGSVDKWEGYSEDQYSIGKVAEVLDDAYNKLNGEEEKIIIQPNLSSPNKIDGSFMLSNIDVFANEIKLYTSITEPQGKRTYNDVVGLTNANNIINLTKENGTWVSDRPTWFKVSQTRNGDLLITPLNETIRKNMEDKYVIAGVRNAKYLENNRPADEGKATNVIKYDTHLAIPEIKHGDTQDKIVISNIENDVTEVQLVKKNENGVVENIFSFRKNGEGYKNPGDGNFKEEFSNGTLTITVLTDWAKGYLKDQTIYARVKDTSNNLEISTSKIKVDYLDKPEVNGYINENKVTVKLPINNGLGTARTGDTVSVILDNNEDVKYTVVLTEKNIYEGNVEIGLNKPLVKDQKIVAALTRNETTVKSNEYIVNSISPETLNNNLESIYSDILKKARANVDSKENTEIAKMLTDADNKLKELKVSSPSQDFTKYENFLNALKKLNEIIDLNTILEKEAKKSEIEKVINATEVNYQKELNKIQTAINDNIEVGKKIEEAINEIKNNLEVDTVPTEKLTELKGIETKLLNDYSENNELNYTNLTSKTGDNYTNPKYAVKTKDKTILLHKYTVSEILDAIDSIKEYNKTNDPTQREKAVEKIKLVDAGKEYQDKLTELLKSIDTKITKKNLKEDAKKEIDALKYLNDAQKDALKTEIDNASETEITPIVEKAKELDTKMKELRDLLELEKPVKTTSIYTTATEESKKSYDAAIKVGEDITDSIKVNEDNKNKDEVQKIIDAIKLAHANLNSDFAKKVDDFIKNELPNMTNLNKAQKDDATTKLKSVTPENFDTLKEEITKLNDKMGVLKTKLDSEKAKDKDNDYKYYNATDVLAKEYDDAMKSGNDVAEPNSMINADLASVEKLINNINYEKLNGLPTDFTKLENETKDEKVNGIKESPLYYNATDEKQQAYDDAITSGKVLVGKKEQVKNKTLKVTQKEVDAAYQNVIDNMPNGKPTSIKELNDLVKAYESIKSLPRYYNDVETDQKAYDNAIKSGQSVIDKFLNSSKVLQKEVDAEVSKIKDALAKIDGLETNKTGLKQTIDKAENAKNTGLYINEKDPLKKDALDKALEKAKEVYNNPKATISDVIDAENKLNDALKALTGKDTDLSRLNELVNEAPEIKKSIQYTAEDQKNKKAYDDAIAEGQKVLGIKPIPTQEEVDAAIKLIEEAKANLNGSNNRLKELVKLTEEEKIDNNYINADKDKKEALDKALEKAKEVLENKDALQSDIENAIEELEKALKELNGDLNKYKDYAGKFVYDDTSIAERFDDDFYANITLGNSITNIIQKMLIDKSVDVHNFLGGLQIGAGKQVSEVLHTRVGGFLEYKNGGVQNIALGANVKTDYITSFIRYRIAILTEIKDAINHNIDLFVKGHYKTNMTEHSTVEAGLTGYLTYSSKTKLNNTYLKDRVGGKIEATTKLAYEKEGLNLYVMPGLNYAYNTQVLVDKNQNELVIPRNNELNYSLSTGILKKFENGINIGSDVIFDGSLTHLYDKTKEGTHRFRVNSHIGYNW